MLRSLSSDLDLANNYIEALLNLTREILIIILVFIILLFVNTKNNAISFFWHSTFFIYNFLPLKKN